MMFCYLSYKPTEYGAFIDGGGTFEERFELTDSFIANVLGPMPLYVCGL